MKLNVAKTLLTITAAAAGLALFFGRTPVTAAPATLGGVEVPAFSTASLSGEHFEKLHKAIAPGKEIWAEIPWETDLAAARARSAKEGKPLLMWIMDGHPLGCT